MNQRHCLLQRSLASPDELLLSFLIIFFYFDTFDDALDTIGDGEIDENFRCGCCRMLIFII